MAFGDAPWFDTVFPNGISCCTFVMCAVPCQTSFVLGVSTLSNFVTPDLFYFAQRVSLFIPFLRGNPVCCCSQHSSGCCAFAWWHTFPQWWTCADIWGWMVTFSNLHWARIRGEKFWIPLWLTHPLWNPHEIFLDPPLPWVNASSCLWHNLPNLLKSAWRDWGNRGLILWMPSPNWWTALCMQQQAGKAPKEVQWPDVDSLTVPNIHMASNFYMLLHCQSNRTVLLWSWPMNAVKRTFQRVQKDFLLSLAKGPVHCSRIMFVPQHQNW